MATKRLTIQQRKEVFHALVTTQDTGMMSVPESRQQIGKHFEQLFARFAQPQHQATFCFYIGIKRFHPPQQFQGPTVFAFSAANGKSRTCRNG